ADFRTALNRPPATPADPPSVAFQESAAGHRIDRVQRGAVIDQFGYNGGQRTADDRFVYQYDEKGRLVMVMQKAATAGFIRRITYSYGGNDRLVGRLVEYTEVDLG